ncbi:hypothetical protein TNCV_2012171 [Trichonephila clavipes]|nr:hypothetical protein TNCV_2012171 [Trichonephila clavipes]
MVIPLPLSLSGLSNDLCVWCGKIEEGRKITDVAKFDKALFSRLAEVIKTTGISVINRSTKDRYIVLSAKGTDAPQRSGSKSVSCCLQKRISRNLLQTFGRMRRLVGRLPRCNGLSITIGLNGDWACLFSENSVCHRIVDANFWRDLSSENSKTKN